jgi:predicted unusual protein kinase regulating ubiquinone biosynthesis (AarF/ABC1/UbiB family)
MAMDFVEGEPLDVLEQAPQARRDAVGALLERLVFRELFEFRIMQTDPNFANYLYQPAHRTSRFRRDTTPAGGSRPQLRSHYAQRHCRRSRKRRARGN